nr:Oligopeptide-binding protein OppA [Chlamydiota bacterium]
MKVAKSIQKKIPEIRLLFPQVEALSDYVEKGKEILERLLPEEFLNLSEKEGKRWLSLNLPLIKSNIPSNTPGILPVFFLCSPTQEVKAERALLEVLRRWLIPEKEVNIVGFHNMYFNMNGFNSDLFFLAEVKILIEDGRDLEMIQKHLPLLSNEIALSLTSSKYHQLILDTKALSLDQKSAQIQLYLRRLTERKPGQFNIEIFQEMSTFFALSNSDFRKFRQPKHLTRVVVSHYLMRKRIIHYLSVTPEKRHLEFRFIRSKLYFPFGTKPVLGLSIAVALSDRYETFEESHIAHSVQKFIPDAQVVKGSYYFNRSNHDLIKYIYVELEKKSGAPFTLQETKFLKRDLKEELKKRIERLIPSVFMIRNEEEVMRNILLLSQELKYLSDLPQVMINFEKQESDQLYFTVVVVRVLKKHDPPLKDIFAKGKQNYSFSSDRVQNVGYIRKKNPKEANVFHLAIPKERTILRADSSVNFYLARQKICTLITEALGEVRDYNGGMILKQGELFTQFKRAFSGIALNDQELLENFFFALNPIEAQATSSLRALKTLFELFLEATQKEFFKRESYFRKFSKRKNTMFSVIRTNGHSFEAILNEELGRLENFSKFLVRTQVSYQGTSLQGLIYETTNSLQQKQFQQCIERALHKWVTKIVNQQELRLSFIDLPPSLDPRLGGDEYSSALIKMLYEGLTRISQDSKPSLALAQSIDISSDQKHYVFKLRPSKWSDGTPLTAYDFEYAWKKILSPSFYTPFAYFFFPIKNAKAAKEGTVSLDKLGVKVINDSTLAVELENPTPEFLEQVAHALYSPINHKLDKIHPNWAQSGEEGYVCNGPMKIKRMHPHGGYEFQKNPNYWDKISVKLDRILISKNNSETAIEMFNNDEIDWIGHPMRSWEPYFSKGKEKIISTKSLGTNWCVFNTQRYPFDNLKLRQAFSYALDREELVKKHLKGLQPALSPLPLIHTRIFNKELARGNKKLAVQLFEEALKELGLTRKTFPSIAFCFSDVVRRTTIPEAIVAQWENVLGVAPRIEEYEFHVLFPKILKGDYQLGAIKWKSWINDPLYTLSAFQY